MKLVIYFFLVVFSCSATRSLNGIESMIKQYKKSTIQLREDEYQNNLPLLPSYDYVIVGAGPSGCVLANRLTEDPTSTVLLLEAGSEPTVYNDIPIWNLLMLDTDYNWKFTSQYNPGVCNAMERETCPWPAGKGIGGATIINGMIFTRGNKRDFDSWAEEGNSGWGYDEVLKYFKKMENVRISNMRGSPYRGKEGPIWVSHASYRTNASLAFLEAGRELGYPTIDFNSPYRSGFGRMQFNIKNGFRHSAPNAYLKPIMKRPNLHIVQRALVSKIMIDPKSKLAYGVEFFKKGMKRNVTSKKEVILSAGAFGSPKILMLSGIGPKQHLEAMKIPVLKDLPVGDNLQEHVGASHMTFLADKNPNFIPDIKSSFIESPMLFIRHQMQGDGPFSTAGAESIAYISSRYSKDDNPDVELFFTPASYGSDFGHITRKTVGIRDDVYNSYFRPLEDETTMSIWVMGCYPKSRGRVRLSSINPQDPPIIYNNFFNDTQDLEVIIDGIKKAIELSETKAMKSHGARLYRKIFPGCERYEFGSDDYWRCTVRQITTQYHHQCGTCKMGPDGDSKSVVDPRLRVRGIKRLRVVDASIMPTIPAGHTQAPAFMIGEKAADMIKDDNTNSAK